MKIIPKLSLLQLDRLSEFTANLGLIFFATGVTPLFSQANKVDTLIFEISIILTLGCLIMSLLLLKGVEK